MQFLLQPKTETREVWCTPCVVLTEREEALRSVPPRLKITGLILDKHVIRVNATSELVFGAFTSLSGVRSRAPKRDPAPAYEADSGEIMQYLQEGNLISSRRQTHPHPINNQPSSEWEESRVGMLPRGLSTEHWAWI